MKSKSNTLPNGKNKAGRSVKIVYWSVTGLVAAMFLMSSFLYLGKSPALMESFKKSGFPEYFVSILGLAKLLGALALVNPWLPKLREWAYAGFTFVLVGAVWTHVATATPFAPPLVFLVLLLTSYFFYGKVNAAKETDYSAVSA